MCCLAPHFRLSSQLSRSLGRPFDIRDRAEIASHDCVAKDDTLTKMVVPTFFRQKSVGRKYCYETFTLSFSAESCKSSRFILKDIAFSTCEPKPKSKCGTTEESDREIATKK